MDAGHIGSLPISVVAVLEPFDSWRSGPHLPTYIEEKWIDGQLYGRSVVVVLIGANTAGRKWINYEIEKGWSDRKGVLGIHVHNLKDSGGDQSYKGNNPFNDFTLGSTKLSSIVKTYDPPFTTSTSVYKHINDNVADWIEQAIEIRGQY